MKLYKIRFIILGLLLRVFFVWCQTCGTKFTDPASSAYLAQAVVEGKVTKTMPPNDEGRYNVTIAIRKVRKGAGLLPGGKKTKILTIGEFGEKDVDSECVTSITKSNQKYFFFLKKVTVDKSTFYRISAFPVSVSKQSGRLIRKAACKTCGKKPELKKIKAKNVRVGKKNCSCDVVFDLQDQIHLLRGPKTEFQFPEKQRVFKLGRKRSIHNYE